MRRRRRGDAFVPISDGPAVALPDFVGDAMMSRTERADAPVLSVGLPRFDGAAMAAEVRSESP